MSKQFFSNVDECRIFKTLYEDVRMKYLEHATYKTYHEKVHKQDGQIDAAAICQELWQSFNGSF